MRTRSAPVERTPPSSFRPLFCPSPACPDHRLRRSRRYRYVRNGFFRRKCDRRRIQRFRCKRCQAGFSQQTFSVTYCMKRPDLLPRIAPWIASGAPLRRITRSHNGAWPDRPCHPATVARLARRIGSQCLLVHEECRRHLPPIREPIVADHFVAFVGMQENALGVATAVGADSWYVYALEPAWHRRATASSRRRRRVASRRNEIQRSVHRMLDRLLEHLPHGTPLLLITDDDPRQLRAVTRHPQALRLRHAAYRNPLKRRRGEPRDPETRARDAAMFPVDLLHKLHRNWIADHRRETLAFGRRGEAVLERLAVLATVRNLIQGVSERRNDRTTPAMRLGVTDRPWLWRDVLAERRFPTRIPLGESASGVYHRTMHDPRGIPWPPHVRKRAL